MMEMIVSTFVSTFDWEYKRKLLSLSVLRRVDMREHTNVKWPIFHVCVWCNCTSIIWREEKVRAEVGGRGSTLRTMNRIEFR